MRKSLGMVKQGAAWTLVVALASVGVSAQQQAAPPAPLPGQPQTADPYVVGRAMPPSDPAAPLLDLTLD